MTKRNASLCRPILALLAAGAIAAAGCVAAGAQPKQPSRPPQPQQAPEPPQPSGQRNALQGFSQNRNEPVNIKSVSLDVRDKSKIATFSGNVQLVQGDTTMRCKTLVVHYDGDTSGPPVQAATPGPAGSQQISRMEAMGGVFVTQKDQTATGERAIYDLKTNTVTLYPAPGGTVAVTQGPNVVRGQSLVVHLDTGVSHFVGGVESLFVPNSTKSGEAKGGEKGGEPGDAKPESKPAPKGQAGTPKGLY